MNAHNEQQWPEYLMLRDTCLSDDAGGLGQRIFTTAGAGYEKRKYIRADLAAQPSPVVKQNLTTHPAAAQEAVAWQWRSLRAETGWKDCTRAVYEVFRRNGLHYEVRQLYAAPVTATPPDHTCKRCRGSGKVRAGEGTWPDAVEVDVDCPVCGGIGVIDRPPAAPGIDLRSNMLRLAEKWEKQAAEHGVRQFTGNDHRLFANELRAQIDAIPKGDEAQQAAAQAIAIVHMGGYRWNGQHWQKDSPKGALNEQFGSAEGLDSPKGAVAWHIQHPDGLVSLRKREGVDDDMRAQAAEDGIVIRPLVFGDAGTASPKGALPALPDDFSESKDWRAGSYAERVEWLMDTVRSQREHIGDLLDSPKGGSEARDAARYRWLREFAVNGSIGIPFHGWLNCDEPASEWDSAIDAAMQAGDAEVQP